MKFHNLTVTILSLNVASAKEKQELLVVRFYKLCFAIKYQNKSQSLLLDLVRRRHYNMGHGIGRSGDIAENQPKFEFAKPADEQSRSRSDKSDGH